MAAKKKAAATKAAPKAATKKVATKKASSKAAVSAPKLTSIRGKAWSQAQMTAHIAERFEVPKAKAKAIIAEIGALAQRHLAKGGVGVFTLPGVCRLRVAMKPATKARVGRNPRTGEEVKIPAKKASKVVRARPVKSLKDVVTPS